MKRATQEAVSPMQYMAEILILKIDKKPTKDRKNRQTSIFISRTDKPTKHDTDFGVSVAILVRGKQSKLSFLTRCFASRS